MLFKNEANKNEINFINKNLSKLDKVLNKNYSNSYNLNDLLDLLPSRFWFGDENEGHAYYLNIDPGFRDRTNTSGWTISYFIDDSLTDYENNHNEDYDDTPSVLCTFGSNEGLFKPSMEIFIWVINNLEYEENGYKVKNYKKYFFTDNDKIYNKKTIFNEIDKAIEQYKIFNK